MWEGGAPGAGAGDTAGGRQQVAGKPTYYPADPHSTYPIISLSGHCTVGPDIRDTAILSNACQR